jgi:hypothetical protein
MNTETKVTLKFLRKKFRNKSDIVTFFKNRGNHLNNSKGEFFPPYHFYDFKYFLDVISNKKKVKID